MIRRRSATGILFSSFSPPIEGAEDSRLGSRKRCSVFFPLFPSLAFVAGSMESPLSPSRLECETRHLPVLFFSSPSGK